MIFCWIACFRSREEKDGNPEDAIHFTATSQSHFDLHKLFIFQGPYPLRSQSAHWLFSRITAVIQPFSGYLGFGFLDHSKCTRFARP
ncbi:hypothetical protein BDV98DRAFT_377447 [Pterulicium gracile]|uniref:Uncharacterized protein n=1 Tax=Pterulicium gracile TaxID=1884261 RepID=A0A5C3Q0N7_9AGAR|nr:hypothetical protein BDV98DRAFT_377447 [Pterula gracilis]